MHYSIAILPKLWPRGPTTTEDGSLARPPFEAADNMAIGFLSPHTLGKPRLDLV